MAQSPSTSRPVARPARRPAPGTICPDAAMIDEAERYLTPGEIEREVPGSFNARSLECWLEIAAHANVDAIPARLVAEVPFPALRRLIAGSKERDDIKILELLADGLENIRHNEVIRHDLVGTPSLKQSAVLGRPYVTKTRGPGWSVWNNRKIPEFFDKRVVGTMLRSCKTDQRFLARPFVVSRRRPGPGIVLGTGPSAEHPWPCEWRVFVINGSIAGISNYYVQAPAGREAADEAAIAKVRAATKEMLRVCRWRNYLPAEPVVTRLLKRNPVIHGMMPPDGIHATLDFLETADGRILFLDGNVPFLPRPIKYGAHPCGFEGQRWPIGIAYGGPVSAEVPGAGESPKLLLA